MIPPGSKRSTRMYRLLWLSLLTLLSVTILATALSPSDLQLRQSSSSPVTAGAPGIVAKIHSADGQDLTSNFQILIYDPENDASSNLTDRDLEKRQPPSVFPITTCRSPGARFKFSVCDFYANHATTLQRYIVQCTRRRVRGARGSSTIVEGVSELLSFLTTDESSHQYFAALTRLKRMFYRLIYSTKCNYVSDILMISTYTIHFSTLSTFPISA